MKPIQLVLHGFIATLSYVSFISNILDSGLYSSQLRKRLDTYHGMNVIGLNSFKEYVNENLSITYDLDKGKRILQFVKLDLLKDSNGKVRLSFKSGRCMYGACDYTQILNNTHPSSTIHSVHLPNFQKDTSNFKLSFLQQKQSRSNSNNNHLILSYLEETDSNSKSLKFIIGHIKNSIDTKSKFIEWEAPKSVRNFNPYIIQKIDVAYRNPGSDSMIGILAVYIQATDNENVRLQYFVGPDHISNPVDIPGWNNSIPVDSLSVSVVDIDKNGLHDIVVHIVTDDNGYRNSWVSIGRDILTDGTVSNGWTKFTVVDENTKTLDEWVKFVSVDSGSGQNCTNGIEDEGICAEDKDQNITDGEAVKADGDELISRICETCSSLNETTMNICKLTLENVDINCLAEIGEPPDINDILECDGSDFLISTNAACQSNDGFRLNENLIPAKETNFEFSDVRITSSNLLPIAVTVRITENNVDNKRAIEIALSKLQSLDDFSKFFANPISDRTTSVRNGRRNWTVTFFYPSGPAEI